MKYLPIFRFSCALLATTLLSSAAWGTCLGDPKASRTFKVSVVPQLPPSVVYARWAPLLDHLGRQTGQCFELTVPETIPAFEAQLFKGSPDFAFANPYHAVMAKRRQGYLPLLIDGRQRLSGLLVVRADSPVRDIRELHGREVAFPAPNAFAASLLLRAHLAEQGIRPQPHYVTSHANIYRAVVMGAVVAGGGVNNTLQREEPALRANLRVLYETPGYAPHPFLAHARVPAKVREALLAKLLALARDGVGQPLLDAVQIPQPVRADYQRDFAPLESLGLDKFVVLDAV